MAKRATKAEDRMPPLGANTIKQMMLVLTRRSHAVATARPRLKDTHFFDDEAHWALLWDVLCEWWDKSGKLPRKTELVGELEQAIAESPEMLASDDQKVLRKFVREAFDTPIREIKTDYGLKVLKKFLLERIQRAMVEAYDKRTVSAQLAGMVGKHLEELRQVESLTAGVSDVPFGPNWKLESINKFPTGIPFFNHFLGGGHAEGECNSLMGPYGSCKTTLGVQLTCEASKIFWDDYIASQREAFLKLAYFFFYEGTRLEMQQRFLVYMARIHKDTMENFNTLDDLSYAGNLKPYEEEWYRKQLALGQPCPGERERMEAARKKIDRNIRFIDCTGHDPKHPERGTGLAPEIGAILSNDARLLKAKRQKPGLVVVDHVLACVERHISGGGGKYELQRFYVGKFPINTINSVCVPFKLPGWILHQSDTKTQAKPPGYVPHHTDSAEAKDFGQNSHFAFNLGTPDPSNLCLISCTKHRRRPPIPFEIIQINGAFGQVLGTNGEYSVDKSTNSIVATGDLKRVRKQTHDSGERPDPAEPPRLPPYNTRTND